LPSWCSEIPEMSDMLDVTAIVTGSVQCRS